MLSNHSSTRSEPRPESSTFAPEIPGFPRTTHTHENFDKSVLVLACTSSLEHAVMVLCLQVQAYAGERDHPEMP